MPYLLAELAQYIDLKDNDVVEGTAEEISDHLTLTYFLVALGQEIPPTDLLCGYFDDLCSSQKFEAANLLMRSIRMEFLRPQQVTMLCAISMREPEKFPDAAGLLDKILLMPEIVADSKRAARLEQRFGKLRGVGDSNSS